MAINTVYTSVNDSRIFRKLRYYVIVRLFNTAGPRQVGQYGMVIPRFIESAVSNKDIVVYGDGKQTRCFAHIFDVIEAINLIAFAENTIGKVINVGNNNEISILDLANRVKKLCNSCVSEILDTNPSHSKQSTHWSKHKSVIVWESVAIKEQSEE